MEGEWERRMEIDEERTAEKGGDSWTESGREGGRNGREREMKWVERDG